MRGGCFAGSATSPGEQSSLRRVAGTEGQPLLRYSLQPGISAWHPPPARRRRRLSGDPARQKLEESETPSIGDRIGAIRSGHWQTRQMPTATQRRNLEIATAGLEALIAGDLAKLEDAFAAAGAPWSH
ncbi:MAG TPA: hypothetical protein DD490_19230 [Acidobacteria bacterium]|nr:hypothetical protein [Acidobacteriota bacterium]